MVWTNVRSVCTNQTRVVTAAYAAIATIIHGWGKGEWGIDGCCCVTWTAVGKLYLPLNRGRYWSVTKRISDECMYCYVYMNDIAWRPSVYLNMRVYFTICGWFLSLWVCVYFRVILEKESIPPPPMPPPPEEGFVVYVSKQKKNLGKLLCIDLLVFPFVLYVKGWLYDGTSRLDIQE